VKPSYVPPLAGNDAVRGLLRLLRGLAKGLGVLALAALGGIGVLAILLARGGYSAAEGVLTLLLASAPAVVLLFVVGLRELLELPDRLLRLPQRGSEQLAELSRLAGAARSASWRRTPLLLWRARGLVASTRDLIGFALPLRVLAPPFLALTLAAIVVSVILVLVGLAAFVVLAVS
jgi:hypothetical protein